MRKKLKNAWIGTILCLSLLTACAGENDGKNTGLTGGARPTVPTVSAEADITDEERESVAAVPKHGIFCGYHYFAALREDGTVAVLGELSEQEKKNVSEWKELRTLCDDRNAPTALRQDGSVVNAKGDLWQNEYLSAAGPIVWISFDGANDFIAVDCDGKLRICRSGDNTEVRGATTVQMAGDLLLDRSGAVYPMNSIGEKRYDQEKMAEWGLCVCIAHSNRSGDYYAVREDGTVRTTSFIKAIRDWTGLASICVSGGMVVGLKKDGTVVAQKEDEGEEYGNYAVEAWENVTEVTTNGYYTVGRTSDGGLLCTDIPPEAEVSFTKEQVEALSSP